MLQQAEFLTRQQAADALGKTVRTVDRYIQLGLLRRYSTPTRNIRINAADVQKLLTISEVTNVQ